VVVQRSKDGGLTYSARRGYRCAHAALPWADSVHRAVTEVPERRRVLLLDRVGDDGDHINLSISQDRGTTWTDCVAAVAPGTTTLFSTADHDSAGNIYIVYGENLKFHTYMVSLAASKVRDATTR